MGLPYRLPLQNPSADPYHISYHPTHCVRQLNTHSAILIILGVFATGSKRSTCVRWTRWRPLPPPRRPHSRSWGRTTLATRCFRSRCFVTFITIFRSGKQCCGSTIRMSLVPGSASGSVNHKYGSVPKCRGSTTTLPESVVDRG